MRGPTARNCAASSARLEKSDVLTVTRLAAMLIAPQKRVGIDWEHHQFMPRDEQVPTVPEPPRGLVWYVEPQARRI